MTPAKRPLVSTRPLPKASLPTTSLPKAALASRRAVVVKKAPREPGQRSKWRWGILAAIVLLFGTAGAYALGFIGHHDRVAEIREKLKDQNLSQDDRQALWEEMGELRRDQRGGRGGGPRGDFGGRGGRGRGEDRIKKVFAMAPADQIKELDKEIDQIQKQQQQWEKDHPKDANANSGQNGAGGNQGAGGRRGGRGPVDPNEPNAFRNKMTSRMPAESRANRTISKELRQVYRIMLETRANQRGINSLGGGGGR